MVKHQCTWHSTPLLATWRLGSYTHVFSERKPPMKSLSLKLMTPVILSALLTANSPAFAKHHGEKAGSMHVLTSETLTKSARSDKDKARDEGRKPAAVLNFLGVKAGNTVLDVLASSGWYSEVLSVAVGNRGKVLAHNTDFLVKMRDGANEKPISPRLADNRLPNVKRVDEELTALTIADNTVEVAITGSQSSLTCPIVLVSQRQSGFWLPSKPN